MNAEVEVCTECGYDGFTCVLADWKNISQVSPN